VDTISQSPPPDSLRSQVLDGVLVIDLSRYIAGPLCGMLLGDLGADVIKVERPGGEDARHIALDSQGESLYTDWFNRNKRAIELDLRSAAGIGLLETLLAKADVLVENFRPGTLDAMGLTTQRLRELNPALVVTSVSGFGQDGPWSQRAAFDSVIQAMSGLMSLTGTNETGPSLAGMFVADHLAALYATIGTISALHERSRSETGQRVDVALLDALVSCMGVTAPTYLTSGDHFGPIGSRDRFTSPSQAFRTADGFVWISAGSNKLFRSLAGTIGDQRLDDEMFASPTSRLQHRDELAGYVEEWTSTSTTAAVCDVLEASGIPYGPVNRIDEVLSSEHAAHRGLITTVEHPGAGERITPGMTIRLSDTPTAVRRPPPRIGEHTDEVLRTLCALDQQAIDDLREKAVIGR
jgi:crotonobetainyl-CoA:carnitine CoA-transferase CaiB-like acyl-CoA transferase